jgi:hypothetical protein
MRGQVDRSCSSQGNECNVKHALYMFLCFSWIELLSHVWRSWFSSSAALRPEHHLMVVFLVAETRKTDSSTMIQNLVSICDDC